MRRELGLRQARRAAQAFLHRFGVRAPEHIRLEQFAGALGVRIIEGGLDGARARLLHGPRPVVRISDAITHPGARRFSLAHELGHLVLGHEAARVDALCAGAGGLRPARRDPDVRDLEAEADTFAAETLMPTAQVQPRCEVSPLDLDVARAIEATYQVSLAAASLRVSELTCEPAAAVFSTAAGVRWARSSSALPWEIERGRKLDRACVAIDYFRKGSLDGRAQPIPVSAWFDSDTDLDLVEHSAAIPEMGAVITMLWIPSRVAERIGLIEGAKDEELSAAQWRMLLDAEFERGFAPK